MTDDEQRFAYLAEGNAKQARKRVAVDLLIRDAAGHVLIVNPTYKEAWDLPGGMAESNEPPRRAGERELAEELGLVVTAGRILTLDWVEPHGPWDDQLVFVFDGGTLTASQAQALRICDPEISQFAFATLEEAKTLLRKDIADRLLRAHTALLSGTTDYSE
ncbi:NUDIX domain-containing protein [Saccharothrix variisporea]|uniref:NUDIX domain-containing protein n=1 Tax=Saccharothrix variisporea TaxID=543527 RepID=A0A495X7V0_9PSEU|nr:NUDIX hydrolase [Saccharothrix variisporea]RKT69466.1 NUDIX domain-containing protein [Saccharothrix variisporea]